MRPPRLLFVLLALLAAARSVSAAPVTEFERWYSILLDEQPAGWMCEKMVREDQRIITTEQMNIQLRRGPVTLTMEVSNRFVETPDGQPLEAQALQKQGAVELRQTLHFTERGITITLEQGQQKQESLAPNPTGAAAAWKSPAALHRYWREQVAAGAQRIEAWTLDPLLGATPVRLTSTLTGRENIAVFGKTVPALVWDSVNSKLPNVVAKEWTDEAGWSVRSTLDVLPGMRCQIVESDRTLAQQQVKPADLPELLGLTFIPPDQPIAAARELQSAVYELHLQPAANGAALPEHLLPRTAVQRVVWADQATARVVVDLGNPVGPGADLPTAAHRNPSIMINSADPQVRALALQALQGQPPTPSPTDKAEILRKFVHRFVKNKDLSVGMATASEVARTAEGDCTEHAVLLAALLRTQGIPSRVVSGLLYVDEFLGRKNVFGYHMWTQAWLDTPAPGNAPGNSRSYNWVDVDAVLPDRSFDATHIALATSALDDQNMNNDMLMLVPILGRVAIHVIEPASAAPLSPTQP